MKKLIFIMLICSLAFSQRMKLNWKLHNVGKVKQLITNVGSLWRGVTDYPGLIYSEYPPNSYEEHVGEGGIWIGAIRPEGDTSVSVTTSWNSSFEFYPSANSWDSIWSFQKGESKDIPYWKNYTGISDQDFVCRYSDYNLLTLANHKPLYVDVIQTSYAWSSPPLDEMIIFTFYIIPTKFNLKQAYIAYWLDGNVGYRGSGWDFALDDYTHYFEDRHLGVSLDAPGGIDETAYGPIGIRYYPPKNIPESNLRWTFNWYPGQGMGAPPEQDNLRYEQMSAGTIMQNQEDAIGSQFIISCGPFEINVGDTLKIQIAEVFGKGLEGLLSNSKRVDWLISQNFRVPGPPPLPPLRVEEKNQEIVLHWDSQPGDINPETYIDKYRADSSKQPFEGYRVYKSTTSLSGPWTLLAEYDIPGNKFFNNTGLFYIFNNKGLLNNLEYYYTVTAFSKPDTASDFPSQESSKFLNAKRVVPGTTPPQNVGQVAVVPNPYRGDIAYHAYNPPWERPGGGGTRDKWMEQDRRIQFINLPAECEIKIYTISGDIVNTLRHSNQNKGYEDWNLTSYVGQAISSGIYLFTVKDNKSGDIQVGKFVVIK